MPHFKKHDDCDKSKEVSVGTTNHRNTQKGWEVFLKIVAVTILPWMAYVTLMLFSIDKRVAIIEDRDVPPRWLVERVERLEDELP